MDGPLLVERPRSGVVLVTLALPERRNAMTPELTAAWAQAMESLDRRKICKRGCGPSGRRGPRGSWVASGSGSSAQSAFGPP